MPYSLVGAMRGSPGLHGQGLVIQSGWASCESTSLIWPWRRLDPGLESLGRGPSRMEGPGASVPPLTPCS
jgi:hypothetical protein